MLNVVLLSVAIYLLSCRMYQFNYCHAECLYAQCRYAECRGAENRISVRMPECVSDAISWIVFPP
jgi:hypothetical protein